MHAPGMAGRPCWLVRLLNQVRANSGAGGIGNVTNVDTIIKRLKRKVNVLNEAWHVPWVRDGLPFIDRTSLRETLKEVACLAGRPILRIEGERGSGKTYSSELLEYVSQSGAWSFRVIKVPVEEGSEIMMNALVLAQIIVGEMGFKNSVADSGLSDPTVHYIPLLQTWILQCARSSGKQWWLFLDGFRALPEKNSAPSPCSGNGTRSVPASRMPCTSAPPRARTTMCTRTTVTTPGQRSYLCPGSWPQPGRSGPRRSSGLSLTPAFRLL